MSISVICPSCQATDRLADSMNGKNVSCKECFEVFLVRGKSAARDRDEDEEASQSSRRPAKRASRDDDDDSGRSAQRKRSSRDDDDDDDRPTQRRAKRSSREDDDDDDDDRPQRRKRPRKKQSGGAPTGMIVAGVAVAILCVAGIALGVWAFSPSKKPQPTTSDSSPPPNMANTNPAPGFPAANTQAQNQTPTQVQTQVPMPGQTQMPPPQTQMPGQGGLAVELSNGNVSGFGIKMEVTVDYRFTSGSPTGRRLFLLIKATKAGGLRQSYYIAELKSIQGNTQGKIGAGGMTFGIENGPFEMFMAEGPPNGVGPLINDKDLTKISNVVTVAGRQTTIPGPPGRMRP